MGGIALIGVIAGWLFFASLVACLIAIPFFWVARMAERESDLPQSGIGAVNENDPVLGQYLADQPLGDRSNLFHDRKDAR